MSELELLDRGYSAIMAGVVDGARAPHFTELAADLDIELDAARELVHELVGMTPGWVHPGTDLLSSFPPFNMQPTQYHIMIDGQGGWYAQCGLEATAIRWLVPGKTVRIESPCLCCGESMVLEMCDEDIVSVDPEPMVGYTSAEIGGAADSRPFR